MKHLLLFLTYVALALPAMAGPDFYLRGHDGNWDAREEFKFVENNGVYTLHVAALQSGKRFKIANADYSLQFGSTQGVLKFDTAMSCVAGDGNDITTPDVAGVTLVFDYADTSSPTLTAVPDLYLAGEFNSWSNTDASYRFTRNGDVYTLTVSELEGPFRIAAGITPDWTVEYGGQTDMAFGTEYDCIAGPGNNMTLASGTDGPFTMTFNKQTLKIKVEKIEVNPSVTDFYLAGTINGWAANLADYKFTNRNGRYELELERLTGEFKIVTSDWALQYGCESFLSYDKIYSVRHAQQGLNMRLAENVGNNVTIIFDAQNKTVEVTGMPTLYLIGEFNNWGISPLYAFSYNDGVYTLSTHNFAGEFKIANADYSMQFGTSGDKPFTVDNNYPLDTTGQTDGNITFNGVPDRAAEPRIKLTLMANGTPTITTSIVDVETDNSPIEYFTLQGIKVARPAPGIYIRRHGSKVDKIAIK